MPMNQLDPNQASQVVLSAPQVLTASSVIQGYTYDASSYQLVVWFKGKKKSVYRYYNVFPGAVSDVFDRGGSIGSNASKMLKGYQKQKLR